MINSFKLEQQLSLLHPLSLNMDVWICKLASSRYKFIFSYLIWTFYLILHLIAFIHQCAASVLILYRLKTRFLVFSWGTKWKHWPKLGYVPNWLKIIFPNHLSFSTKRSKLVAIITSRNRFANHLLYLNN